MCAVKDSTTRPDPATVYSVARAVARLRELGYAVSGQTLYRERRDGRLRMLLRNGMSRGYVVTEAELRRWAAEEWEVAPCAG